MINANIPLLAGQQQTDLLETAGRGLQLGQGLRQMLALRQAGKMNQIEADNEADTYAQRKAFANNSMFGRELNAALKADQAAKAQALMAQQKHEADTAKTWSDATKNNADAGKIGVEAQGLGLKNSGTLLENANRALTVAAQTGDPMAAKLALNNAYKAGTITPELYEQYTKQVDILGTDPEALKQFAQNITLASAEKPEQYIQPDANTVLNNETSVGNNIRTNQTSENNNIRTTQASMYSTDVNAETADKNRQQNQQQFDVNAYIKQNTPLDYFTAEDGTRYAVYAGGKGIAISNDKGEVIKATPKAGQQLSATAQKELFEVEDSISAANNALVNLKDALKYSANAYDGVGAAQRAKLVGHVSDIEEAKNTVLLDNIVTGNALEMLKATFGGAPTEGERAILLQLQGSVNLPRNQREAIYTRAIEAAERRIKSNQTKAESIRNGSFFKSGQQTQSPSASGSASSAISAASSKYGI